MTNSSDRFTNPEFTNFEEDSGFVKLSGEQVKRPNIAGYLPPNPQPDNAVHNHYIFQNFHPNIVFPQ